MTGTFTIEEARQADRESYTFVPSLSSVQRALGWRGLPCETRLTIGDVAVHSATAAMWCLRLLANPRDVVRAILPTVRRASMRAKYERLYGHIDELQRWLDGNDSVDLYAVPAAAKRAKNAAWWDESEKAAWAVWAAANAASAAQSVEIRTAEFERLKGSRQGFYAGVSTRFSRRHLAYMAFSSANWAVESIRAASRCAADGERAEREAQRADLIGMFPPIVFVAADRLVPSGCDDD